MAGDSDNASDKVQEAKARHRLLTAKDVALAVVLSIVLTCVAAGFIGRSHSSQGTKPIEARTHSAGFTLIEMSIVLIIIGLIIGGVLVGQDLARAAGVRAQITQIEKYNSAVNTFYGKYQALPGDMNPATASQFGFAARGLYAGEGDGNGILEGVSCTTGGCNSGFLGCSGETAMFWVDLSSAVAGNLIGGSFTTATAGGFCGGSAGHFFPAATIGQSNYVYVWSMNSKNYFGLSAVSSFSSMGTFNTSYTLSARQAYDIDRKIDDGKPITGNITICSVQFGFDYYAGGAGITCGSAPWAAAPATTTSCWDNGGVNGGPLEYSVGLGAGYGAGTGCALSFQFQ